MTETTTSPPTVGNGKYVPVDGVSTHYHDEGSGPAVLLLHGSGPGVSAWANWSRTIPVLAKQRRVVAPDIVGFGYTQRPETIRYGVKTWSQHVMGLMDTLNIDRFDIVGNSMGGRLAMGIADDHPSRVGRLILMGSGGVKGEMTEGLRLLRAYQPSREAMRELISTAFVYNQALLTDELVEARYQASAAPGAQEAYWAMFHDPQHEGDKMEMDEARISAIEAPSLIIHGRFDNVVPLERGMRLLELIPNSELHVFRCGHWTQIECADRFNHIVLDFLSAPTAAKK